MAYKNNPGRPENFKGKGFHTNPERINKKGRPKLPSLQEEMAKLLSEEKEGLNALSIILQILRREATKGNIRAIELLLKRAYPEHKQDDEPKARLELVWGNPNDSQD
jgi:hypothetical protein